MAVSLTTKIVSFKILEIFSASLPHFYSSPVSLVNAKNIEIRKKIDK